jgi:hypothetical protein
MAQSAAGGMTGGRIIDGKATGAKAIGVKPLIMGTSSPRGET